MDAAMIGEFVKQGGVLGFILLAAVTYFLRKEKESIETAKTVAEKLEQSFKERERIQKEAHEARLHDQELFRNTLVDLNGKLISSLNLSATTQEALADTVDSIRDKIEGIHAIVTQQQPPEPKKRRPGSGS